LEVEATDQSGDTKVEYLYVSQRGNKMAVDLTLSNGLSDLVNTSRTTRANAYAKTISNACNAALTDIDEEVGIGSELNGIHTYKGSDFKNLQPVTLNEDSPKGTKLAAVKYKMAVYYDSISEIDEIRISISNGICMAVAIRYGQSEDPITGESIDTFGTYPNVLSESERSSVRTLDQAMQHAQKQN
jgi:hypothetical protein